MVIAEDDYCKLGHTLTVLLSIYDSAILDYQSIDAGYDSAFSHYEKSVEDTIQPSIDRSVQPSAYMRGSSYFECTWAGSSPQSCPIDTYPKFSDSWDLYFDLKDKAGYFRELNATYGIMEDWVTFGTFSEYIDRECHSNPCFPSTRYVKPHQGFTICAAPA